MKRAIQGIRYDTLISEEIGFYRSNRPVEGLDYWWARLFRTPRSGHYFLHGGGGPMTRFNSASRIIPLTHDEAKAWSKEYLNQTI